MKKLVNIIVTDKCSECPFCSYDPHYGIGRDSGFDCEKMNKRICDDNELSKYEKQTMEIKKNETLLFPTEIEKMENPLTIPSWCPLVTIE